MLLLVTTTAGRPKAFAQLTKIIDKQTVEEHDWLVVTDDWEDYKFPRKAKVIKRDNSKDTLPSICHNWLAALDFIEAHPDYDRIVVLEDDDFYHREYLSQTKKLLDQGELVGWAEDAYYYVLSRKAKRCHNVSHASLATTAFKRSVLPYLRECVNQGQVFIDMLLWYGIKQETLVPQPPVPLSDGTTYTPAANRFVRTVADFKGKRLLADNFTGLLMNSREQAPLNKQGNRDKEYPRHVGLKETWHSGKAGLSERGHDAFQGGGPDIWGDKLRDWLGADDAAFYLAFTKEPSRQPYPPNIMLPLPIESI